MSGVWENALVAALGAALAGCSMLFDPAPTKGDDADASSPTATFGTPQFVVEVPVMSGEDDALEDPYDGLDSDFDWCSLDSSDHYCGMRFPLQVPQGAEIVEARVSIHLSQDNEDISEDDAKTRIFAESTDDASSFESHNISSRIKTAVSVTWDEDGLGEGSSELSPDLSAVVQKVVDRAGWTKGNHIAILWNQIDDSESLEFYQFDRDGAPAPRLSVTWQ